MAIFDFFRRKNKVFEEAIKVEHKKALEKEEGYKEDNEEDEEYLDVEDDIELPSEEFGVIPEDEDHKVPTTKIDEDEEEEEEDDELHEMEKNLDKELGLYQNPKYQMKLPPDQLLRFGKNKKGHKFKKGETWGGKTSERNLHREVGGTEIDYDALKLAMERGFGGGQTINELIEKSEKEFETSKEAKEKLDVNLNYKRYIRRKVIKGLVKAAMSDGKITKDEYKQIKKAKKGSVLDLTI